MNANKTDPGSEEILFIDLSEPTDNKEILISRMNLHFSLSDSCKMAN